MYLLEIRVSCLMRYVALASDYDGTLAHDGTVSDETVKAVDCLRQSGRRFILVTGRELPELQSVFPALDKCDRVVAENGALLYNPATRQCRRLAERPPDSFIEDLRRRGVTDLSVGDVILATWRPHETAVLEAIRDAGLELQVIFNKDAVMVLPAGVNKSTGLCAALADMKLSMHNVAGIGDAENDHAFLQGCECSVAVANAIPALKEKATFVTQGARGDGVRELIQEMIENDLSNRNSDTGRRINIGKLGDDLVALPVYGQNGLVCGMSGSGKSTFVTGLVERILDQKYQVCLIDPEGDYEALEGCRTVGDESHGPSVRETMQALDDPSASVVVNLIGVQPGDRAGCFNSLWTALQDMRAKTGRPHWIVIDEAHHVLPAQSHSVGSVIPEGVTNLLMITVHPKHTSAQALAKVNIVTVVGSEPRTLFEEFASATGASVPANPGRDLEQGEAAVWFIKENRMLFGIKAEPSRTEHHRHKRKYSEGKLEEERQFRFRGPGDKVNLPAQNLSIFVQLAQGIDADTWKFHRERHDYSCWLRTALKDEDIGREVEQAENDAALDDHASRERIKDIILAKYTVAE